MLNEVLVSGPQSVDLSFLINKTQKFNKVIPLYLPYSSSKVVSEEELCMCLL